MSRRKIIFLFVISLAIVGGSYLTANDGALRSVVRTDVSIGLSIFAGLNLVAYDKTGRGRRATATHIRNGSLILDDERDDYTPEELAAMIDPKLVANNLPGPGIQYVGAWFQLADDEAILIRGVDTPCRYWSCQQRNHRDPIDPLAQRPHTASPLCTLRSASPALVRR